jgi:phage-related holin
MEGITSTLIAEFYDVPAVTWFALVFIIIDMLYGGMRRVFRREEAPAYEYLETRVTSIFILVVVWLLDHVLGGTVLLLDIASFFYIAVSVAHIIDTASEDGVPLPPQVVDAIHAMKGKSTGTK